MRNRKTALFQRLPFPLGIVLGTLVGTVAIVLIGFFLLVNIDELATSPGIAESESFRSGLRKSMSREDVEALQAKTKGSAYGSLDSLTLEGGQVPDVAQNDPLQELVWFTVGGGFCWNKRDLYILRFTDSQRLVSWRKGQVSEPC